MLIFNLSEAIRKKNRTNEIVQNSQFAQMPEISQVTGWVMRLWGHVTSQRNAEKALHLRRNEFQIPSKF